MTDWKKHCNVSKRIIIYHSETLGSLYICAIWPLVCSILYFTKLIMERNGITFGEVKCVVFSWVGALEHDSVGSRTGVLGLLYNPTDNSVTLAEFLNLSTFHFISKRDNTLCLTGLWGLNEITHAKCLALEYAWHILRTQ